MFLQKSKSVKKVPKVLFIAVLTFVLLDAAMLGLNFAITKQVDLNSAAINLAGRQRMLSQRIDKALLQLSSTAYQAQWASQRSIAVQAFNLFDTTLQAMKAGGETRDALLNPIALSPLKDARLMEFVDNSLIFVNSIRNEIIQTLNSETDIAAFGEISRRWSSQSEFLLTQMNQLVIGLESSAQQQTKKLRLFQSIIFVLGALNFFYIIHLFTSQHRAAHRNIKTLEEILQEVTTPMLISDAGNKIIMVNRAVEKNFGLSIDQLLNTDWNEIIQKKNDGTFLVQAGSEPVPLQLHTHRIELDTIEYQIISMLDISQFVDRELELSRLAHLDPLTGVLNRRSLFGRLEQEFKHAQRTKTKVALIFIDLDGFKQVNDLYGHDAGDKALVHIADSLKRSVRDSDSLLRIGGDEFVLIAPDCKGAKDAVELAEKLIVAMKQPFTFNQNIISLGGSLGVALYPTHSTDIRGLILEADAAMYRAKAKGSGVELALQQEDLTG